FGSLITLFNVSLLLASCMCLVVGKKVNKTINLIAKAVSSIKRFVCHLSASVGCLLSVVLESRNIDFSVTLEGNAFGNMIRSLSLVFVVSCLLDTSCLVYARSATNSPQQNLNTTPKATDSAESTPNNESPSVWSDVSMMYRIYRQCASENLSVCLKIKLLMGLEKAFRNSKELKIIDGIKFVNNIGDGEQRPKLVPTEALNEKLIEANLPRGLDGKEETLNEMIFNKLGNFLQEYTLQVKFPDVQNAERSFDESRKKKDKKGSGAYIMIPLLLGGTFVPIAYGALAMLAGKALIVSKLALVLASIIGIKKLLNSGGSKESQHEVVVSSGGHSSGWGRDIDLAYNAYDPKSSKKQI
ncbi:uncharacterized protein LOC129914949, partial [Episyrphus balteatus]|uniref:uncharacterized protein LOC129914949 n=1 Tax=Episyrphus balteatus TaxID=286459 RepID=UPI0024864B0D